MQCGKVRYGISKYLKENHEQVTWYIPTNTYQMNIEQLH